MFLPTASSRLALHWSSKAGEQIAGQTLVGRNSYMDDGIYRMVWCSSRRSIRVAGARLWAVDGALWEEEDEGGGGGDGGVVRKRWSGGESLLSYRGDFPGY